jgi:hypothetical protein
MTPKQQFLFEKSKKSMPEVRSILGRYILRSATPEEDMKQATDLVLEAKNLKIAVRVRDSRYANFANEFTIRSTAGGGVPTEFQKIMVGHADWLFYGFEHPTGKINPWYILDLSVFRTTVRDAMSGLITIGMKDVSNNDGSAFKAFQINTFPPAFVIASSDIEKGRE